MAQYMYVKSGFGTRTSATGYTSEQTGTFTALTAANCYASIADADTYNTIATDDFIMCANDHDDRASATTTQDLGVDVQCNVLSVDANNCEVILAGAVIGTTGAANYDFTVQDGSIFHGVDVESSRYLYTKGSITEYSEYSEGSITVGTNSNGKVRLNSSYSSAKFKTVDITFSSVITSGFELSGAASRVHHNGGTIDFPVSTSLPVYMLSGDNTEVIVSNVKVLNTDEILNISSGSNKSTGKFTGCTFPSGAILFTGSINDTYSYAEFYNSDIGNVHNIFTGRYFSGNVETVVGSIYLSGTYNGTNYYSFKAKPNTNVSITRPLKIKVGEITVDTSTAKTFTVHVARDDSTTALTDTEIWSEVEYPDDTTTQNFVEHDRGSNILAAGTAQPNGSTWTGLTGSYKEQKLEVTTTNTGKNGVCSVYVYIAVDVDVYVCPKILVT